MNTDTIHSVRVAVDYGESLADMIKAGKHDYIDDRITTEHFPLVGKGIVQFEAKVFHFGRDLSSKDAVRAIESNAWQPAPIEALLAFGAHNFDQHDEYSIIGLGSIAEVFGRNGVPQIRPDPPERGLHVSWWDRGWDREYRFLAVRKLS